MESCNKPEGWGLEMKADLPVLTEEPPWSGGQTATDWTVDRLDGTKEFDRSCYRGFGLKVNCMYASLS